MTTSTTAAQRVSIRYAWDMLIAAHPNAAKLLTIIRTLENCDADDNIFKTCMDLENEAVFYVETAHNQQRATGY